MNKLKNATCYLCGAMDRVDEGGVEWRRDISPKLKDMGLGVLDPCNKPTDFAPEDGNFRDKIIELKKQKDYNEIKARMKDIVAIDLRMVDLAHFVIMYIDLNVHMCGSYHEAFVATQQKKPLLIVCKQGKHNVPNWMFGVIPHEHMFSTWDGLLLYLHKINIGQIENDHNRWRFFNFEKVYQ